MSREVPGCTGKVRHYTRRDARKARSLMHHTEGHLQAYCCKHCGWWHLGTLPRSVVRGWLPKNLVIR